MRTINKQLFRAEIESHLATVNALIDLAIAEGRDPRDLRAAGTHLYSAARALDHYGPPEPEAILMPADRESQVVAMVGAVLTLEGAVTSTVTAAEAVAARLDAVAARRDFGVLVAQFAGINSALRLIASILIKGSVVGPAAVR